MSETNKDGGYLYSCDVHGNHVYQSDPLTKREQFAAAAMQGLCAATPHEMGIIVLAKSAVAHADALIRELDNEDE